MNDRLSTLLTLLEDNKLACEGLRHTIIYAVSVISFFIHGQIIRYAILRFSVLDLFSAYVQEVWANKYSCIRDCARNPR